MIRLVKLLFFLIVNIFICLNLFSFSPQDLKQKLNQYFSQDRKKNIFLDEMKPADSKADESKVILVLLKFPHLAEKELILKNFFSLNDQQVQLVLNLLLEINRAHKNKATYKEIDHLFFRLNHTLRVNDFHFNYWLVLLKNLYQLHSGDALVLQNRKRIVQGLSMLIDFHQGDFYPINAPHYEEFLRDLIQLPSGIKRLHEINQIWSDSDPLVSPAVFDLLAVSPDETVLDSLDLKKMRILVEKGKINILSSSHLLEKVRKGLVSEQLDQVREALLILFHLPHLEFSTTKFLSFDLVNQLKSVVSMNRNFSKDGKMFKDVVNLILNTLAKHEFVLIDEMPFIISLLGHPDASIRSKTQIYLTHTKIHLSEWDRLIKAEIIKHPRIYLRKDLPREAKVLIDELNQRTTLTLKQKCSDFLRGFVSNFKYLK